MTTSPPNNLILRPIQPGDIVTGFSLGTADGVPLKNFLKKCAKDFHRANIAKSYVLVPEKGGNTSKNPILFDVLINIGSAIWGEVFPNAACVVSLIDRLIYYNEMLSIEGS